MKILVTWILISAIAVAAWAYCMGGTRDASPF
jgi:hypothetical protein